MEQKFRKGQKVVYLSPINDPIIGIVSGVEKETSVFGGNVFRYFLDGNDAISYREDKMVSLHDYINFRTEQEVANGLV